MLYARPDAPRVDKLDRAAQLLRDAANGDQRAFATLYDEYASRLLGMAVRVLVDRTLAEDVTQEVFLEIWQHAATFDPQKGSGINWMLTLTRRRAIDRVRSEQSARDRDERIGMRQVAREVDDTAEAAEGVELRATIGRALATLSEVQRSAISLQYSGYSQSEIAARLGVPLGTVKTRVRDGMAQLRLAV
jgi:RNA polymerase sigma-70 factor, ECF subfamily